MLSFVGTAIAGVSFFMILFLFVIASFWEGTSSYLGLFMFIILPIFLLFGLLFIPIGMWIEIRRRKKMVSVYTKNRWPVLDLNISRYRNAFVIFGIGTLFLLFLTGVGSYEAFHYSESVEFCGTLCHEVMEPEYVTYQNSPHARVSCVDCHVGEGANWYVKSKLSGIRQVYAVITNDFNRPIKTPIVNLRPARETCEKCHWPEKFYARQLRFTKHYLADSLNTEWNINLQMKIGPSHSAYKLSEGIHWHINTDIQIEYIPKKNNRKKIPWVKYTNLKTGEIIVYQDTVKPLKKKKIEKNIPRKMDCMDCHNRPSHYYYTPQAFVDFAMTSGDISSKIPFIKKVAMEIFKDPFENSDSALAYIHNYTIMYYKDNMPLIWESYKQEIETAISNMQHSFSNNIFPEMGASWDSYMDHTGHKVYDGCFRCHTGQHVSKSGKTISRDCNLCHTIVIQGKTGEEKYATLKDFLEFIHPVDIKGEWRSGLCTECHRYLY